MELRHESYTAVAGSGKLLSWSRFLLICLFSPLPLVSLLLSPLPSVSLLLQSPPLGIAPDSVPTEEGWAPRGCLGGAGRRAGATEGLGAARVPRRGGRRAGATEGAGAARVPRYRS